VKEYGAMIEQLLKEVHIAPSILSADFGRLEAQVAEAIDAGARVIHVDVMDGHFVPNITIGPVVVKAIAPMVHERGAALDVHLMIESPERYVDSFVEAGADTLVVHQEACVHLHSVLAQIRQTGAAAGVAVNPATPLETLTEARYFCDLALVMSVNPGFGGQSFIPTSLAKLTAARAFLPQDVALQVDGGVTIANVAELVRAGANWLVAGSSVYGRGRVADNFRQLSSAAGAA
jgi:ribulose-phosphate 3-epimerase